VSEYTIDPADIEAIVCSGFNISVDIEDRPNIKDKYLQVTLIGPGYGRIVVESGGWDAFGGEEFRQLKIREAIKTAAAIVRGLEAQNMTGAPGPTLRPEVMAFARAMEDRLRLHDHDRGPKGWQEHPDPRGDDFFADRAAGELKKVRAAVEGAMIGDTNVAIMREAADLGNFAMMLHDRAQRRQPGGGE